MVRVFIFIFFGVVFSVSYAQAQSPVRTTKATDYQQSFLVNPHYNKMAREALKDKPKRFGFMRFRSLYSRTRQYDPIGENTLKSLNNLAYIVFNEQDPDRIKTALFGYQSIVSDHLAHLGVVMQALSLAREDRRFGNPSFFEWVKEGIIRTVVISGDGFTLQGAYDVITLEEETVLFHRLGIKPVESRAVKEGFIYYNMHDVEEVGTKAKRAVFVNTTIPMKYLEALSQEQDKLKTKIIRKQ